ncbi:MAG: HWE histidine kinase domain-containing protein [Rhodoplanes sp.]
MRRTQACAVTLQRARNHDRWDRGATSSDCARNATEFPVEIELNPFRSGERLLVVASVIDIGERKRKEEHIEFIMRELSHRSKNLLEVVLSIANQTIRASDVQKFESRLMALAPSNLGRSKMPVLVVKISRVRCLCRCSPSSVLLRSASTRRMSLCTPCFED